jgi:hypothetical protein
MRRVAILYWKARINAISAIAVVFSVVTVCCPIALALGIALPNQAQRTGGLQGYDRLLVH